MANPAEIVVVGSMNLDLIAQTPRFPEIGETILGGEFHTAPGGKGANQAVAAVRLGANVEMIGRVGKDRFGEILRENLEQAGVKLTNISLDVEQTTGVALILVDVQGRNNIVVAPGANATLKPEHIHRAEQVFAGGDCLLLQLESPPETVIAAAKLARKHGLKVILNPAPIHKEIETILPYVDVLIPNESEAAELVGHQVSSPETAIQAAQSLLNHDLHAVVITMGEQGAVLVDGETSVHIPAFPVQAVDTVAAGDAFVAGYAVAVAEGKKREEAVRWGCAAGALTATRSGAQPSLPDRGQVIEFLSTSSNKLDGVIK